MVTGREQTLKTLHAAATEIQTYESVEAACQRTVAAAEDILEFEMSSIELYEEGWLVPVAKSSEAPPDGVRRMRADQGLAGKTYQQRESFLVEEITPDDETDPAKDFYRSAMSVPVGSVGVFQAVSRETAAFDEDDVELAELLVAHTAQTVHRIRYEDALREKREELRRQNERLEEFVSVVSHDLRNPLNVAGGQLVLAREECDSEHLDRVADAHARMETLISDLLTLAREGSAIEETEPVTLADVVEEAWLTVDTVDIDLDVQTGVTVLADRSRLRQVIENLLRNAVEHATDGELAAPGPDDTPQGPAATDQRGTSVEGVSSDDSVVTVTVGALDDGFYVEDDGPGIPPDERETVFERGYSSGSTGSGFGLAIVESIVDAHGWTISVSDGEEGGARFEITGVEYAE